MGAQSGPAAPRARAAGSPEETNWAARFAEVLSVISADLGPVRSGDNKKWNYGAGWWSAPRHRLMFRAAVRPLI